MTPTTLGASPPQLYDPLTEENYHTKPVIDLLHELISCRSCGPKHIDSAISLIDALSGDVLTLLTSEPFEAQHEAAAIHQLLKSLKICIQDMKVE